MEAVFVQNSWASWDTSNSSGLIQSPAPEFVHTPGQDFKHIKYDYEG